MQAIDYAAPTTLDEAIAVKRDRRERARVLSGGTDIIVQVREGRRPQVDMLLDVKRIAETTRIELSDEGLTVGAAVPCYQIYENAEIARRWPALVDSASLIGGTQIQSRASLGGNLCNASPAADSIPSLIALGAQAQIAGANGRRSIPVEEFCVGPGQSALADDEILVSLFFPAQPPRSGSRFLRFIPRNEMDIAVANAAVALTLDATGTVSAARVAIGAVAPTPLLVPEAGAALVGQPPTAEAIERAVQAAVGAARPITDMR
ncbi:MAG TPA: xanthine dehydrogenase family protein subunit M, partial [Dehalococcoidia bacterium]|nr:xanthine dehydrogenase family protein subunit M [Dehalococcoidia bacterium]